MSDVLEYNCSLGKPGRRAVQDIDKLITGQDPDGDRPYYAHLGISMLGSNPILKLELSCYSQTHLYMTQFF